jgi:hypothetical protein
VGYRATWCSKKSGHEMSLAFPLRCRYEPSEEKMYILWEWQEKEWYTTWLGPRYRWVWREEWKQCPEYTMDQRPPLRRPYAGEKVTWSRCTPGSPPADLECCCSAD